MSWRRTTNDIFYKVSMLGGLLLPVAGVVVLTLLGLLIYHVDAKVRAVDPRGFNTLPTTLAQPVGKLNLILDRVDTQLEVAAWKVNGDGGSPTHPHTGPYDGILTKVYKDLRTAHEIEFNANREQLTFYRTLNATVPVLLAKVDTGVELTNADLRALGDVLKNAGVTVSDLGGAIVKLGDLVDDPDIKLAIQHLAATSAHVDDTTQSLALLMHDVQGKVHETTHPSKRQRALGGLLTVVKLAYYLNQLR